MSRSGWKHDIREQAINRVCQHNTYNQYHRCDSYNVLLGLYVHAPKDRNTGILMPVDPVKRPIIIKGNQLDATPCMPISH